MSRLSLSMGLESPVTKKKRGFAAMTPEKQREIASKGGKSSHAKGTAHQFTPDEAKLAGKKGGQKIAQDRRHMAELGRLGGMASAAKRLVPQPATGAL